MAVTREIAQRQTTEVRRGFPPEALDRLATVDNAVNAMVPEERAAAFQWLKSKYRAEWPSDLS